MDKTTFIARAKEYAQERWHRFLTICRKHGDPNERAVQKFSAAVTARGGVTFGGWGCEVYESAGIDLNTLKTGEKNFLIEFVAVMMDAKIAMGGGSKKTYFWPYAEKLPPGRPPLAPGQKRSEGRPMVRCRVSEDIALWVESQPEGLRGIVERAYWAANPAGDSGDGA